MKIGTIIFCSVLVFCNNVLAGQGADNKHDHQSSNHADHLDAVGDDRHEHEGQFTEREGHAHDEHEDHQQSTHISDGIADFSGISLEQASPRILRRQLTVYGKINAGPAQLSHVRARFRGLIVAVKVDIGQQVQAGQLLAEVESNSSLRVYKIHSPIAGKIVERHANKGEATDNQVLFSIANFDQLWAEFRIFPSQHNRVKAGQLVKMNSGQRYWQSHIQHLIPALDKPYQLARVQFDNRRLGFTPGMLVEADVQFGEIKVDLAVAKSALQTLEGKSGVFIKQQQRYVFTPLGLGVSDDDYVEVTSGLEAGQYYVMGNSYLLKADLEKSAAEHVH